jgi:hypothetical protein
MKPKTLAALVFVLSGLAVAASALEWNVRQQSLTAAAGVTEVRGKFEFNNPGKSAVHIVDLTTSCGCTVATASSWDIPAGSRGIINFVFTIGKRTGLQEKKIFVQTDESPDPVALELRVQLPEAPVPAAR